MDDDVLYIAQEHPTLRLDETRLRRALAAVFAGEQVTPLAVGLILTGHAEVQALNKAYLDHDYETDVLSFSLSDGTSAEVEGEVYVDLDTAMERHAEFDTSFEEEALRYCIHGVLHLIGYDDATPEARAAMHALETRYLAS